VFLNLTGHKSEGETDEERAARSGKRRESKRRAGSRADPHEMDAA
jgi:hypothetical protein